jgi:hypothetical protein
VENSVLPSGGNTFTSYSGSASMTIAGSGQMAVYSTKASNTPLRLDRGIVARRYTRAPFSNSSEILDNIPVGAIVRMVRICMTANATQFTGLQVGNQSNGSAYAIFDASAQVLNQWVEYPVLPGSDVTPAAGSWQLTVEPTVGNAYGCAGVIEIEYYIP